MKIKPDPFLHRVLGGLVLLFLLGRNTGATTISFDGVNDQLIVGSQTQFKLTGNTATWEAWINPDVQTGSGIILNKEGEYEFWRASSGNLFWAIANNTPGWFSQDTGIVSPSNQWMHVAFAYNGAAMLLYTNGVLAKSQAASGNIGDAVTGQNDLRIGVRQAGPGSFFHGQIDEVRIWNVARAGAEVAGWFNRPLTGNEPGLLAYYPFEEGAGTVTFDATGKGLNGVLTSGPIWNRAVDPFRPVVLADGATAVTTNAATLAAWADGEGTLATNHFEYGPGSTALRFDGVNDYVNIDPTNSPNLTNQSFSVEFWARRTRANATDFLFSLGTGSTLNSHLHFGFRSNNKMTFAFYLDDLDVDAGGDDLLWHHWAFTFDSGTKQRRVYHDGILAGQDVASGNFVGGGGLRLGYYQPTGAYFTGGLDEFRIWKGAVLDAATIQDWMFKELDNTHPNYAALDGYWKFDEGAGTVAMDSSGHGRDGTILNGPIWQDGVRPSLTEITPPVAVSGTNAALDLDGTSGYVAVPAGLWFSGNFTIEMKAFIRTYSTGGRFLDFANGQGQDQVILSQDGSGHLALHLSKGNSGTTSSLSSTNLLPLNQWVNLAVTFQGSTATLYLNGQVIGSGTVTAPGAVVTTLNWIGRPHSPAETYGNEILDDIRIWNVARTVAEIRAGLTGNIDPAHPNLLLNYRFDGGAGTAVVDSRPGYPRNGTMLGGASRVGSSLPMALPRVAAPVSGLASGKRYQFRSVAQSTNGTSTSLINGLATLAPGRGTALDFDGKDDQVTGIVPQLPTVDSPYTIEAWIKPNVMGNNGIIGWGNYGVNNQATFFQLYSGGLAHQWRGDLQTVPVEDLTGAWHHVAASYDGTVRKVYVDGELRAETISSSHNVTTNGNFSIGKTYDTDFFDGQIDEVRVWNIARTDPEIAEYRNERLVGDEPGLVLYARLDEGGGTITKDSTANATELGLLGGPEWAGSTAGVAIPLATTLPATEVGFGVATLKGRINLEGSQSAANWFEYGLDGSFANVTALQALLAGVTIENVSTSLTNLQGGRLYTYRFVAANGNGTNYGAPQTFYMPLLASGSALQFSGSNYVNMGDSSALKVSTAITMEAWIFPTGRGSDISAGGIIVNKEGEYEFARFPDGTLRWAMNITSPKWSWVNTGVIAPSNQWMHVAFVYNSAGGGMQLFTNGVLAGATSGSGPITDFSPSLNELWIGGRQGGGQLFQGVIDEVRVWNYARLPADIAANYNRLLNSPESGLLLNLHFDEGAGSTTADAGPNHFVGTLGNGSMFIVSDVPPTSPLVTTLAPSPVLATSVTLRGSVNSAGDSVTAYFEYGPTVAYGSAYLLGNFAGSLANQSMSAGLAALEPGTTYNYRLVAYTPVRTNYGANRVFTTLVLGSGWPVSTKLTGGEASAPLHVLDGLGNTYVAGVFSGSAAFKTSITPAGGATANAFVGKMSRTADWLWAMNIPASSNGFTSIKAIALDSDRNIYVAGQFAGTNTFGGTGLISTAGTNLFVAKLGSLGTNWLWAKSVGGTGPDSANAITVTGTNVFIAGSFSGTANFTVTNLDSAGGSDVFVARLDTDGNWLWAQRGGGPNNAAANAIATDNTSVFIAGQYAGTAVFGTNNLNNAGGTDLFVAKLTAAGAWLDVRRGGSTNNDTATAMVFRTADQFYLVGQFGGTADYGGTLDNVNVGSSTNIFVLRLDSQVAYADYFSGGPGTARSVTVDSLNKVYVAGDFSFATSFGTNSLISSGNRDVFVAQLFNREWIWAQKIGSAGTETAGSISADADNTVVVSGAYQGTIQIGYVALSTPNNRDIFVARLDANRVFEHNNYTVGREIPVPVDAQSSSYTNGAIGQPIITILEKDRADSDELNSFVWSLAEHKLFPVRQVTAIFKWPLTTNPTNTAAVVTAVGRITYPTNPVVHIANTPADLEPAVPGFPLKFLNLSFTTINGAAVDASTKQFTAPAPGWSVLQFLNTGGQTVDPTTQPSQFEVVRTVAWNDSQYLVDNKTATIGTALTFTNHSDPVAGKNGYVYFENAFYDGAGNERAYDRATRSGPIIPVNQDTVSATDDLVVVWYQASEHGIGWPGIPVRYIATWPATTNELVLANGLGSRPLDLLKYPNKRVYSQPDRNLPGFNPNEEHAALYGDTLYALRNDLNNIITPKASEPYTLLKYLDPVTGQWAMKVYKVVTTNDASTLTRPATAGMALALPEPLSFLDLCNFSNQIVSGPGFQDYLGRIYARAAGPGASGTNIVTRYWYPLQPDFFYDLNLDGIPDVPVGTCVPWLDRLPGGVVGTPVDFTYNVTWPTGVPTLQIGETLLNAKFDLPDLRKFASANVIFDQGNPLGTNALESLVRLFDPLSARTLQLATNFVLPGTIATANDAGKLVFTDLPYSLRSRLRYDALTNQLSFSGLLDESVAYGGPDNPLLLLNVLSPRERDRIALLSSDSAFLQAVTNLYDLSRNPNRLDADHNGQPDKTLLIGLTYAYQTNNGVIATNIAPEKLGDIPKALTAGPGTGTGFITIVENNDASLGGLPVALHVIRIADGPFRGDIKVLYPDNVFDEKLTLRHGGDFGGEPQRCEFQWYYMPDDSALNHTNLPSIDANGDIIALNDWTPYPGVPAGANGFNDITIGDGVESGLLTLADNWFLCRYRGYSINGQTNWSDWVGVIGGGGPQFAEGWVKRVLFGLDPFEARTTDFHANASITFASMLQQAGSRYEGDIAFNSSGANLNSVGLISAYQTVLNRARNLSVDATPGINYPPANNALLLAASRISDLYMLLGNEAYADAADPTIGFRTDDAGYGTLAPSIFTFQNQLDSLLEEELVLLRGRDDKSATVRSAPVYNRLFWNFTHGEGEVAYAQAYNITDQNHDGLINADDARIMYPQGHGDAWGHYLTAIKAYYALLQSTNFDWIARSESISLAGVPVEVDYLDERKFATAAAAKARTGAELVDLTYRLNYVDDPAGQYQGYKDTDPSRAWGLSEWAHRAGSGAFFDWVTANAILPATDPNTNHVGIEKIDRTTVAEVDEIVSGYETVQSQVDKADQGLNPLGLAKNVVPFDIDPSQIAAGKTHFEQIYDRANEAMNNAVTVFNHANQLSQALRGLQDTVNDFSQSVDQQERDYKNRLIEIFGYPYNGDIGPGGTFPSGYDGPDLYHYSYVNAVELNGEPVLGATSNITAYYTPLGVPKIPVKAAVVLLSEFFFGKDIPANNVTVVTQGVLEVSYPVSSTSYGLVAPAGWGERRAPGELQQALSDMLQSQARLKQALGNYDNLLKQIDDATDLLNARFNLQSDIIRIRNRADATVTTLRLNAARYKVAAGVLKSVNEKIDHATDITTESLPKVIGLSTDATAPVRGGIKAAGVVATTVLKIGQAAAEAAAEMQKTAEEDTRSKESIEIENSQYDYEIQQQLKALEQLIRQEPGLRLEAFALRETLLQNVGRYQATLARGERLMEERIAFRKNAAAETQASRYQDMTFRIFRNDAIQKYRAQFDLAARYVYLAAVAYDFETQLLGDKPGAGRAFLTDIIRQRALGEMVNGVPIAGRHGLADPLARLSQNFGVLKGQLGFNNPQTETGRFSLRSELFRQRNTSDEQWQAELKKSIVPDLWQIPEFRRYCRPFAPESAGPQPGLVIRFPTTVTFGLNYFGWPLGGGDSAYDSTLFATKVRSAGVWFENYLGSGLSQTPRVYLVPVGADVMRSPAGNDLATREWRVVDQKIPVPFPIGFSSLNSSTWIPMNDSLSDTFADIRRFSSFRAYHDSGVFDPSETITDSRLIGRSVWNTDWMLIIPGGTFLFDPNQGLDTFINSVGDIKIFFQTYAYSGD